jgi:hypothetical protein
MSKQADLLSLGFEVHRQHVCASLSEQSGADPAALARAFNEGALSIFVGLALANALALSDADRVVLGAGLAREICDE